MDYELFLQYTTTVPLQETFSFFSVLFYFFFICIPTYNLLPLHQWESQNIYTHWYLYKTYDKTRNVVKLMISESEKMNTMMK